MNNRSAWLPPLPLPEVRGADHVEDSQVAILRIVENQPEGFDEVSYGCRCGRMFRKLERNED